MKNDFSELIEYLDGKFNVINKNFKKIEKDIKDFKNETNDNFDKVFSDTETLKQENIIRNGQEDREKKFHKIVVKHLETGHTSREEFEEIAKLDIL